MPSAFIDDGYTLEGYIAEDAELDIEAVKFQYRPATARENTLWQHQAERLTAEEKADRDAKFLADHVISWSLKRRDGTDVKPDAVNCAKVNPVVAIRMMNIISVWAKSDTNPEAAKGN